MLIVTEWKGCRILFVYTFGHFVVFGICAGGNYKNGTLNFLMVIYDFCWFQKVNEAFKCQRKT